MDFAPLVLDSPYFVVYTRQNKGKQRAGKLINVGYSGKGIDSGKSYALGMAGFSKPSLFCKPGLGLQGSNLSTSEAFRFLIAPTFGEEPLVKRN